MLPLGFAQGPGQALSLGRAWEEGAGMASGAQVGLAMATQGFFWCSVLGVALYHWGRRRGWLDEPREGAGPAAAEAPAPSADDEASADMDPLTRTLALIAVLYLSTWGVLQGLSAALAGAPKIAASIAGFHFLIGLGFAVGARAVLQRRGAAGGLHQPSLGRVAGVAVDVTAAAAIAAVRVDQIADQMVIIIVFGTICAALTAVGCVWLGSRAFRTQRFAHVLVLFGTMTGTLPTGLALVRLADPGLSGAAPRSFVGGTTLAALMGLPLILFVLPFAVAGWPDAHFSRLGLTLLLLLAYLGLLMLGWRRFSQLSPLRGPLWAPLPGAADADAR
jgi:ESS family glutamate:Na+ symporter